VCRAIINSSFVGITQAETVLCWVEIFASRFEFASSSTSMPSQADAVQMRCRISAEFSPMPAVKTQPIESAERRS
jgi:hypothetical protein